MIALWIGAFANGLLGAVAVSNGVQPRGEADWNVPVRRQRPSSHREDAPAAPGKTIEEDYEESLDEPDGKSLDQTNDATGGSSGDGTDEGDDGDDDDNGGDGNADNDDDDAEVSGALGENI